MKFAPKTEKQLIEESLWPAGEYAFTVLDAEETTSKTSGKPMIKLSLTAYNDEGHPRKINDYLMESMAFKLRHFCYGTGLAAAYEDGSLEASAMVGKSGRVLLKIEEQPGYMPRNAVKDYLVPKEGEQVKPAPNKAPVAKVAEDEVPF